MFFHSPCYPVDRHWLKNELRDVNSNPQIAMATSGLQRGWGELYVIIQEFVAKQRVNLGSCMEMRAKRIDTWKDLCLEDSGGKEGHCMSMRKSLSLFPTPLSVLSLFLGHFWQRPNI